MTDPFTLTHSPSFPQRVFLKLMGSTIPVGGELAPGVTRFADSYSTSYALTAGDGKYILIDSGADKSAKEILGFLHSQGASPADVIAIFLTHAHPDHFAGLRQFPDARVYVSEQDKAVLEGTAPSDGLLPKLSGTLKIPAVADISLLQTVADEQVVTIGTRSLRIFALPGHTRGSLAYLVEDILFVGDALTFGKNKAIGPPMLMSYDSKLGVESLRVLIRTFESRGIVPRLIVPTHSAEGTLETLKKLVL